MRSPHRSKGATQSGRYAVPSRRAADPPGAARVKLCGFPTDFDDRSDLCLDRPGFDALRRPDILDRNADGFVVRDLVCIFAARPLAGYHLGNLRDIAITQDTFAQRDLQVSGVFETIGTTIDHALSSARDGRA